MILFLVRKYVGIFLVLALLMMSLPTVFGASLGKTVWGACFWSGLAAAPLTYWELRRHSLWPLYDNLRLPRLVLLAVLVAAVELLILAASLVFSQ